MPNIPTELTPAVQIITPERTAEQILLQKLNEIIRVLRDHDTRIEDLEP
jgi:hypothetical protein